MRHATMLVAILAFTPLHSATAQVQQPPVELGARVRVTILRPCPDIYTRCAGWRSRHNGTFLAWKADSLVMESKGDTLALPLDSVTTLEVAGRRSQARSGAGIGGMTGAVIGVGLGFDSCTDGFVDPGGCALVGGLFFGAAGALLGALLGANVKSSFITTTRCGPMCTELPG